MKKIDWDSMYPIFFAVFCFTVIGQAAELSLFEQLMLGIGFGGMVGTLMRYSKVQARRKGPDRPGD